MPLSLAGVLAKHHTCTLTYDDQPLVVTFRPYRVEERIDIVSRAQNDGSGGDATMTHHLADVLIKWDLVGEDGQMYPTDFDALLKLPGEFIGFVVHAIMEQQRPNSDAPSSST